MAQALHPLLDNAVRHARRAVTVAISRGAGGRGVLRARTTARGSRTASAESLFEPGVSGAGGAGLGLALARRLARSCGGEVSAIASGGGRALPAAAAGAEVGRCAPPRCSSRSPPLPLSCGHATPGRSVAFPSAVPAPTSSHVITIVMENKEYGEHHRRRRRALRQPARGAATGWPPNSYGVRHPSLPDYLALTSGSTHGIDSDCTDCHVDARNVVDQLEAAHLTWKAYMEDMPKPCFRGAGAGGYAKKHNPFAYYDDVAGDPRRCRRIVPLRPARRGPAARPAADLRRSSRRTCATTCTTAAWRPATASSPAACRSCCARSAPRATSCSRGTRERPTAAAAAGPRAGTSPPSSPARSCAAAPARAAARPLRRAGHDRGHARPAAARGRRDRGTASLDALFSRRPRIRPAAGPRAASRRPGLKPREHEAPEPEHQRGDPVLDVVVARSRPRGPG